MRWMMLSCSKESKNPLIQKGELRKTEQKNMCGRFINNYKYYCARSLAVLFKPQPACSVVVPFTVEVLRHVVI